MLIELVTINIVFSSILKLMEASPMCVMWFLVLFRKSTATGKDQQNGSNALVHETTVSK